MSGAVCFFSLLWSFSSSKWSDQLLQGCVAGTRILLRETSLMPDIPGLPALVTMLFTPIMELRLARH